MARFAHDWDENGFCRDCAAMQCMREVKGYGKEHHRCLNEQAIGFILCARHKRMDEDEFEVLGQPLAPPVTST